MLKLLLGDPNTRKLKRYQPIVTDINVLEEDIAPLSDDQLKAKTAVFREALEKVYSVKKSNKYASIRTLLNKMEGNSHVN